MRLLLLLLRKDDKPIRKLAQRHLAGDDRLRIASLRIAPGHSRLQSSRLPTTDINHRLLGKTNQKGTHLRPIPFGNQSFVSTAYDSCTPQYSRWFNIDAKPLATTTMSAGIMKVFCFSLYSLFLQYTPNYRISRLLCCLVYSTGIYTHPFTLKPFHHGPY